MKRKITLLQVLVATFGLAIVAGGVWAGMGAQMRLNSDTQQSFPEQTRAGILAAGDAGVNVMSGPAPTAVGQALQITSLSPMAAQFVTPPDGGVTGAGTAGYIPEWDSTHHLTLSTLWESGDTIARQVLGNNLLLLESYTTSAGINLQVKFRHSKGTSIGSLVTTTNNNRLGSVNFSGVNTVPAWAGGALIEADQLGTAGTYIPTRLSLATYSDIAFNSTQLLLNPDNSVSMSGPVSAANLPYCKDGQTLVAGTAWGTDTNTGTVTSRSCQTIPSSSTTTPSLVQLSTTTPLMDTASGNVGSGLTCARGDHQHPTASAGLIYYATSGAGFSTTMPGTTTELTQAMASGSATINLATSSGTPGLGVWPAGTLNFDVWAYMANPGGGCTYTLEATNPPTTVAAVRGASTPYQTGSSTAGVTLTGSYAEYKFTIPVSQLTGTSTDTFKTPLVVTSTNSPTCNAATLHIGVGTGQATNIGTLFYQVPSLDGVEYQVNKNAANGYCPLDSSTLVPVANLPAGTESVAGTMSAADKTKLDGIQAGATVDAFTVKAAVGSTPGYLGAVCESTDSSVTIGQTGDYVTFAANFGTGASQVCSGATCAGLQSQLPACAPGQVEQFGTVTRTGTDTNTTTNHTCQNAPWEPVLPNGSNGQVWAFNNLINTNTTTAVSVKTPSVAAGNGLSGGGNPVTGITLSANISTKHDIDTSTGTSTVTAIATAFYGDNAQVRIPVATTTGKGIAQAGSNATINSSTNTGTVSSTSPGTFMPADATANGDHKVNVQASSTPAYLQNAVECNTPLSCALDVDTGKEQWQVAGATNSVFGVTKLDPNAPPALDGGPAVTGSRGLAADSGNKPKLGSNSPTPGDVLIGASDTTTVTNTSTNTVTGLKFGSVPESKVQGLVTDLGNRPTGSFTTGHYAKATGASTLGNGFITDSSVQPQMNGNFSAGTTSIDFTGPAQYSAMELPRGELLFSNTNASNQAYLFSNAYTTSGGGQAYRYTGPAAALGMQDGIIYALTAPSGTQNAAITWVTQATISSTGITGIANQVRGIYSSTNASDVTCSTSYTPSTLASNSTSGNAGTIVIAGAVSALSYNAAYTCPCYVQLSIDSAAVGPLMRGTAFAGSGMFVSLSPAARADIAAGGHTVYLKLSSTEGCACTVPAGNSQLIVTEYTN